MNLPQQNEKPIITLFDLEREYIIHALERFGGHKTRASEALGITVKTLYNRLHKYGLFEKYRQNNSHTAWIR